MKSTWSIATVWAFGVIVVSIVVDFFRARALSRTAKQTQSQALEADALHFSSDLWSSLAVLIGLGRRAFRPVRGRIRRPRWWWRCWSASPAGGSAGAPSTRSPTWRRQAPPNRSPPLPRKCPAWSRVEQVRARARRRQDLHRSDRRGQPHAAARPRERDQGRGRRRDPPADAGGRADRHHRSGGAQQRDRARSRDGDRAQPRARRASCHGARPEGPAGGLARPGGGRQALAARRPRPGGRAGKRDRRASSAPAWKSRPTSSRCSRTGRSGREAPPERVKAVEIALAELAAEGRTIRDVHDVRVRETDEGEIVNFHCRVDPQLSVQTVHEKVDALERALQAALALDQARDRPRRADALNLR